MVEIIFKIQKMLQQIMCSQTSLQDLQVWCIPPSGTRNERLGNKKWKKKKPGITEQNLDQNDIICKKKKKEKQGMKIL